METKEKLNKHLARYRELLDKMIENIVSTQQKCDVYAANPDKVYGIKGSDLAHMLAEKIDEHKRYVALEEIEYQQFKDKHKLGNDER